MARNNQQAPQASQITSHILQESRTNFFLHIKVFALILGSSNLTQLFLFHSFPVVTEKLGTRKQTKLEQLPKCPFMCKYFFQAEGREITLFMSGLSLTFPSVTNGSIPQTEPQFYVLNGNCWEDSGGDSKDRGDHSILLLTPLPMKLCQVAK